METREVIVTKVVGGKKEWEEDSGILRREEDYQEAESLGEPQCAKSKGDHLPGKSASPSFYCETQAKKAGTSGQRRETCLGGQET